MSSILFRPWHAKCWPGNLGQPIGRSLTIGLSHEDEIRRFLGLCDQTFEKRRVNGLLKQPFMTPTIEGLKTAFVAPRQPRDVTRFGPSTIGIVTEREFERAAGQDMITHTALSYRGHRFPPGIIQHRAKAHARATQKPAIPRVSAQ
jgi:hypothetical protein